MKKWLFLIPFVLLSACVTRSASKPPAVFDFGLPPERSATVDSWTKLGLEVDAPAWADSREIVYRLAYENPLERREYAESRWAGAPVVLIEQSLRQQLGLMGNTGLPTFSCLLRIELREFSQVFDAPGQSRGVLHGHASLIDKRRNVVSGREFVIEKPAASPGAHGGVAALVDANSEFGRQLAGWLDDQGRHGESLGCR